MPEGNKIWVLGDGVESVSAIRQSRPLWISGRAKCGQRVRQCLMLIWMQVAFAQPNLTEAILTGADLRGAKLYEANLRGANLTDEIGADLTGAINVSETYKHMKD